MGGRRNDQNPHKIDTEEILSAGEVNSRGAAVCQQILIADEDKLGGMTAEWLQRWRASYLGQLKFIQPT